MESWHKSVFELAQCLNLLSIRDEKGAEVLPERAFEHWTEATQTVRRLHHTVYLIGNGASASMSSHMAADLAKNGHVHTEVFSDLALVTAIANDMGYDQVFSEPIRRRMRPGDMLVAISSSGESRNVVNAVETANALGGHAITLTGMAPSNTLSTLGTLNFYVPAQTYGLAETCHAAILHHWMDRVALTAADELPELFSRSIRDKMVADVLSEDGYL